MIYLASDHAGYEAKTYVTELLTEMKVEYNDLGTDHETSCHYPEYAKLLVEQVLKNKTNGILICGSGVGVSMVANRFSGIRAALCRTKEEAKVSREHNNSNVLCIGGRISDIATISEMIEAFLNTDFEGGRHGDRVSMFDQLGEKI